jgi:hypothetical protein
MRGKECGTTTKGTVGTTPARAAICLLAMIFGFAGPDARPIEVTTAILLEEAAGGDRAWQLRLEPLGEASSRVGPSLSEAAAEELVELTSDAVPRSLVLADLDGDRARELVVGYATATGGALVVWRGDRGVQRPGFGSNALPSADAPARPPFGPVIAVLELDHPPDLLLAADLDDDGRSDLVHAPPGASVLGVVLGGEPSSHQRTLSLPGRWSEAIVGEIGRHDGRDDLVVAVDTERGPRLVVYSGWHGALSAPPEEVELPGLPSQLLLGDFDRDVLRDLALVIDGRVHLLGGRHRRFDEGRHSEDSERERLRAHSVVRQELRDEIPPPAVTEVDGLWGVSELAIGKSGDDAEQPYQELLARAPDGWLAVHRAPASSEWAAVHEAAPPRRAARTTAAGRLEAGVLAELVARLDGDAVDDRVLLLDGWREPVVVHSATGSGGITVNSPGDQFDGQVGDSVCDTGNATVGFTGFCTLRAAIQEHNTGAFGRPIAVGTPPSTPIRPTIGLPIITVPVDLNGGGVIERDPTCLTCPTGLRLSNAAAGSSIQGLVIRGFSIAIQIDSGDNHVISGNRIGTDNAGGMAMGGTTQILLIDSSNNEIRDNIIAGVVAQQLAGASNNTFYDNFLGISPTTGADLLVGGINGGAGGGDLTIAADNVIASGGVEIEGGGGDGSRVEGNAVGSDATGESIVGTSDFGIRLVSVDDALVRDNLVVGQTAAGISVSGANAVIVENRVGISLTGGLALPNADGIIANGHALEIMDNVSSGNTADGIELLCTSGACSIDRNRAGTDLVGAQTLGNGSYGIKFGALGGSVDVTDNVVDGNLAGGIFSGGGADHFISANQIGSGPGRGNSRHGILLQSRDSQVVDNRIADTRKVGGVQGYGIEIQGAQATGNLVVSNQIGLDADGIGALGNQNHGVLISNGASNNEIGAPALAPNLIAHNFGGGVVVSSGTGNSIRSNSIFDHPLLTIDLGGDGPTANDPLDPDGGPNNRQNAPTVLDLGANKQIDLSSNPNEAFRIELFSSDSCATPDARTLVGTATLNTDGAGNGTVVVPSGARVVAATATRASTNDTSELSACVARPALFVNSQRDGVDLAPGDGECDTGLVVTIQGQPVDECTLRAAVQEANAAAGADAILFDPNGPGEPGATPTGAYRIRPGLPFGLPAITETVRIGGLPGSQDVDVIGNLAGPNAIGLSFATGADDSEVRDLAIYRFSNSGIDVDSADRVHIRSSYLGTDSASQAGAGNGVHGIRFSQTTGGIVGGVLATDGNVISGNTGSGVSIESSSAIQVLGNRIGTNVAGSAGLGNGSNGITLVSSDEVEIGSRATRPPSNLISGNLGAGVSLVSSDQNRLAYNWIGIDAAGLAALPNARSGVEVGEFSDRNLVDYNVLSGNLEHGVRLSGFRAQYNEVAENFIGLDPTAAAAIGNQGSGVVLQEDAHDNHVGFNSISANGAAGILLANADTVRNELTRNDISGHPNGLAIDLLGDGVTPNDPADTDPGPNHLQNFPAIDTYLASGDASGTFRGAPFTPYVIELYLNASCDPSGNGEAERFASRITGTTDATGQLQWQASPGVDPARPFLTALAIRQPGPGGSAFELDTSELSACAAVDTVPPTPTLLVNEVDARTGALPRELVELLFRGAGAVSLTGKVVVFFDGDTDASYAAFDLDGAFTDTDGRYLLGNADVPGVDLVFDDFLLQDGPDAVAVYQASASDFPDGTPVTTDGLLDAVVYGVGPIDPGLAPLLAPDQPSLDEAAAGRANLHSLQRCPDGAGDPRESDTFAPAPPTPEAENRCVLCQLFAFDSPLSPDPLLQALLRENLMTPVSDATVFFEVVEGPSLGASGAGLTDAAGSVRFEYDRPAGACGADTVEASGLFDGLPFVCRAEACPWCPEDADLVLLANPAPGPALFQACGSITAQDAFTVDDGDDVIFRASRIVLGPGFSVTVGGVFVADTQGLP